MARSEVPAWLTVAFAVAVVLIVVISFLGGDPTWVADAFTSLLVTALPGIILGAVAGTVAAAITKDLPLGAASGTVTFVLYLFIRFALM